jgi:hypothetical protein
LQALMENADNSLTRQELHREWPDTSPAPSKLTLWKWLSQLVKEGRVLQDGQGKRKDPYRYTMPGMIDKWQRQIWADLIRRSEEMANRPKPLTGL